MRVTSDTAGFTLVELILTMVVAGILFAIATMSFVSLSRKAEIEKTARELVADLNAARSDSIFRGKRHGIVINSSATGYIFRRYSSNDEGRTSTAPDPPTSTVPSYGIIATKQLKYNLSDVAGSAFTDSVIEFDRNGFAIDSTTRTSITTPIVIRVNPISSGAAFDCVIITATRTNIGKMEGGSCVQQ